MLALFSRLKQLEDANLKLEQEKVELAAAVKGGEGALLPGLLAGEGK